MTIKALYPNSRPSLDLNFARTRALDPRITFTRASTGTFVGSNGLIQNAASNVARFDHNPATGESLGLLVEEARTNTLLYSQQLTNAYWDYNAGITTIPNNLLAPDGTLTGLLVTQDTSNSAHGFGNNLNIAPTDNACLSIFVKSNGCRYVGLSQNTESYVTTVFDLTNGTVVSGSGQITFYGNGWYRISEVRGQYSYRPYFHLLNAAGTNGKTFTGDGVSGAWIWGFQKEAGAFPTSYIPTTTATVTRAADVASMTGTNFSTWYNVNQSTFSLGFIPAGYSNLGGISITYNLGPSRMEFSNSGEVYTVGSNSATLGTNTLPAILRAQNKFAYSYEFPSGSLSMSRNGSNTFSSTPSPSLGMPTHTEMRLGFVIFQDRGVSFTGTFSRLTYYPVRLPDAQLQALTQ
jgi:hypothetical protein